MRSEEVVARIVDMAKMLYDERKVRDRQGLERKARLVKGLFLGLSAVPEWKAWWDNKERRKVMWKIRITSRGVPSFGAKENDKWRYKYRYSVFSGRNMTVERIQNWFPFFKTETSWSSAKIKCVGMKGFTETEKFQLVLWEDGEPPEVGEKVSALLWWFMIVTRHEV